MPKEILKRYLLSYDHSIDQSQWFDKIRTIAADMGYAARSGLQEKPDEYKGHVGHVSTVISAVMGRNQSPDIWAIQQILGEARRARIAELIG